MKKSELKKQHRNLTRAIAVAYDENAKLNQSLISMAEVIEEKSNELLRSQPRQVNKRKKFEAETLFLYLLDLLDDMVDPFKELTVFNNFKELGVQVNGRGEFYLIQPIDDDACRVLSELAPSFVASWDELPTLLPITIGDVMEKTA